jgi:hypothetical protein
MEFYSAIKKNKTVSFAGKWMELEIIVLSKISQTQQDKYHMSSLMCQSLCFIQEVHYCFQISWKS